MKRLKRPFPRLKKLSLSLFLLLPVTGMAQEEALAVVTSYANADNSIPAILNYAQQEQEKQPPAQKKPNKTVQNARVSQLQAKNTQQQSWLTQKDQLIRQLQAQLEEKSAQATAIESKKELELNDKVKQLTLRTEALIKQAQIDKQQTQSNADRMQHLSTERDALQKQVADFLAQTKAKDQQIQSLEGRLAENLHQQQLAEQSQQQLSGQINTLNLQSQKDNEALKTKADTITKLTLELASIKKEVEKQSPVIDLKKDSQQQAYSIGVSLGSDILEELATRESQGVPMDHPTVLQGIKDVFADTIALDKDERTKALSEASQAILENLNKIEKKTIQDGQKFQQQFAKQKGVQFKDGVYSRIDHAGDDPITPTDIVTVVMKETLADGTVINDMEAAGKVWSQPLKAYPPIFREPLLRLGNHGTITIVVPPDLAYGSKGLPPKIPPGATMSYQIRVVDVEKAN